MNMTNIQVKITSFFEYAPSLLTTEQKGNKHTFDYITIKLIFHSLRRKCQTVYSLLVVLLMNFILSNLIVRLSPFGLLGKIVETKILRVAEGSFILGMEYFFTL